MIVHEWRFEQRRFDKRTAWGDRVSVTKQRAVCSCGHHTQWRRNPDVLKRLMGAHAQPGQISLDLFA